jgi:hypothetical protein
MIALPHSTREQAHLAYLAGERVTKIAQDMGLKRSTVAQWASRGRWDEDRKAIVTRTRETVGMTAEDVTNCHVVQHIERIQEVVTAQIDTLAKIPLKEAHSILEVARALKTFDDVARRNLGISNEEPPAQPAKFFNFNIGSMKVAKKCDLPYAQPPVIEAETTKD